jgi:hypothetical protein
MPVMMEKIYDALRAAKVPEPQARAAAVEAAEHESPLATIHARLSGLETRRSSLKARTMIMMLALGLNLALTLAVLAKLFAMR